MHAGNKIASVTEYHVHYLFPVWGLVKSEQIKWNTFFSAETILQGFSHVFVVYSEPIEIVSR